MFYVVTYWNEGMEPVITLFDNLKAAEKAHKYFSTFDHCVLDKDVPVYSNFEAGIDKNKGGNI